MKIALAQYNYHIGNLLANVAKIKEGISRAKREGADIVVFSELSLCGYPPKDLLLHNGFITACEEAINDIAKECTGIAAIVGAPARNLKHEGKSLFNAAFFLADGKIMAQVNKTLLPFYDVFDEYRYFEPAEKNELIEYKGFKIALTICEDIWNEVQHDDGRFYHINSPLKTLCTPDTHCIINIAASPFSKSQIVERWQRFYSVTTGYRLPLFYINTLGANTELIFDGGSLVMDSKGKVVDEMNYFSEDFTIYDLQSDKMVTVSDMPDRKELDTLTMGHHDRKIEPIEYSKLIYHALILGIRDYFKKNSLTSAVLGLSGGIDSAIVLVLAAEALGAKNVHPIMLPSKFTSQESLDDAMALTKNVGCDYESISIEDGVTAVNSSLTRAFTSKKADITEENIQSRMRAIMLMAVSNKMGYLLLNTSNKSELATGYGTLYGDMSGAISVLGDVYKTQVYELANYINTIKPGFIPANIISKPPTAELKPNQKDSDSLPEYDILDKVLYEYIELETSPTDIKVKGADAALIKRITDMVNRNEFKRQQAPPILRVSPKAFGPGRRMPIVAKYL